MAKALAYDVSRPVDGAGRAAYYLVNMVGTNRNTNPCILSTHDELMSAVPWGRWRTVLVYLREHAGREWVRLRTFNRHRQKGCWYPSPRFFVVPMDCAFDLGMAIESASLGEKLGPVPEWYHDFEKQYDQHGTGDQPVQTPSRSRVRI